MDTGTHLGLAILRGAGLSTLLALVLVGGLGTASPAGHERHAADGAYERVVQRAAADHRCTTRELGSDQQAASALIRTPGGNVRVVSFEKGWDVYNGERPGSLIAVCLDDREAATQRLRVEQRLTG